MPRTSAITNLQLPEWGGLELGSRAGRVPARKRTILRGGAASEIVVGALLVLVWAALWAVFVAGVFQPGAALHARAAEHPSLDVAVALPDARPGAEPGPVDTTGRAP